jgi:S-adenosylmethionine:tRNA ribosyltransferase-isomerase
MDKRDLLLSSYDFHLPEELIAQRPMTPRDHSKLLVYKIKEDKIEHRKFYELPELLPAHSHLVFNQSKVFPCRLVGQKETGSKFEIFFLNIIANPFYPVMIRSNKTKKMGDEFKIEELVLKIEKNNEDGTFQVSLNLNQNQFLDFLNEKAKLPIPPYIRKGDSDEKDKKDYQTIYAKDLGSVAAPTAGLHFTPELFENLKRKNIHHSNVTLHVGLGTFKPIIVENILEHQMHSEIFHVSQETANQLNKSQQNLIAVGTTTLRVLESLYHDQQFHAGDGETNIFLYPGQKVHSINGLITNFHLPKSSLLMLVSALLGREKTLELYAEAIRNNYRFFSYGDAMLILR